MSRTNALVGSATRNEESYASLMGGVGDAALPAVLEQAGHRVDRLGGGAGPLEAEADEVHADQGRLRGRRVVGRADTLIADGHGVLVDPVLGPPQPGGTGEEGGVGAGVPDRQVLGAQGAAGRGTTAEGPGDLDLAGWAVRVLGEHHAAGTGGTQRVAHDRSVGSGPACDLPRVGDRDRRTRADAARTGGVGAIVVGRVGSCKSVPFSRSTTSTFPTLPSGADPGTSAKAPSRRCAGSVPSRSSRNPRSPRR